MNFIRSFMLVAILLRSVSGATVVNFAPGIEASDAGLTSTQISGLQTANFNTLVLFSITIETNGDFYYGGGGGPNILLCTNGTYVGPANWGSLLSQCKESPSSISRIEMCIGGWLDQSFLNIKNLVAANGTGADTVLYKNLSALKSALSLDAMDYDDEYEYDSGSAVAFGQMCAALGMSVTLCPYTNPGYWQQVVSGLGSTVDYVYLQCYAGGQGNGPGTWSGYFGGSVPVLPGDWDPAGEIGFLDQMQVGANEGCIGGWYWPSADNGDVSIGTLDEYIQLIHIAFGPNLYWKGGSNDFNSGGNWAGGAVPGTNANAINDSGSNNVVAIRSVDPVWNVNDLWAGDAAGSTGAFVQSGSTVNIGNSGGLFRLGGEAGAVGYYTLLAGALNVSNNLDVGEIGTGILNVFGGMINIGVNGIFDISDTGTMGVVTQTNGTVNCGAQMWLGQNTGTAIYTLKGGALHVHNWMAVGRDGGTGTFIMTGGTLSDDTTGNIVIGTDGGNGSSAASVGLLEQSGGAISCQNQFLVPEENATSTGTYDISGTAILECQNWIAIGRNGGTGFWDISGGAITKSGSGAITIGAGGPGTVTQTGGVITNTATATWIGESSNATWTLGGGSDILGQVIICEDSSATGTLNLDGGLFQASGIASASAGSSTVNFNGGTLQAGANNASFVSGLSQASIKSGGAIIDSQSFSITIPQALLAGGGGGLTKIGTGTLTLTATNTFAGPTTVSNGTLAMAGSGKVSQCALISVLGGATLNVSGRSDQTLTLASGQTLTGAGKVIGNLNAAAGSIVNPGTGIGTLTVQSNITLNGTLLMELNRTNSQNCDLLVSTAGTINAGGTLTVTNLGPALQAGDIFHLFTVPVAGFKTVNLPTLAANEFWTNTLAIDGTIGVLAQVSRTPPTITTQVTNDAMTLAWPTDHTGWTLQAQTNASSMGLSTNWVTVPNSTNVDEMTIAIDSSNGSVFFRLVYTP
jgi:autotransporter-associated beta strand protein